MELDDLATQRQPDARSLVMLARMQPGEDGENLLGVARIDADAVVGDGDGPELAVAVAVAVTVTVTVTVTVAVTRARR